MNLFIKIIPNIKILSNKSPIYNLLNLYKQLA